MIIQTPSVFDFDSPQHFLAEVWKVKSQNNPNFSIRAWAKQLGLNHHNALYCMVRGKRKISPQYVFRLINNLKLSTTEAIYFDLLVNLQQAKTTEEKISYLERLKSIRPKDTIKFAEIENFHFIREPLHFFILELVERDTFEMTPEWIKSHIETSASSKEIYDVFQRLETLGLIEKNEKGKWKKTKYNHFTSQNDIPSKAIKEYHENVLEMAKKSIWKQEPAQREFQGFCLNINPKRLPQAKEKIREILNEFVSEFEAKEKNENQKLYQLNINFFGLEKSSKE